MAIFYHRVKLLLPVLLLSGFLYSQGEVAGDAGNGYDLFEKNCTACHKIDAELVGPPLGGVLDRLSKEGLGREWLQLWIKDNKALRESGDAYANKIYNQYNKSDMLPFPDLTEQNIDDIIAYTVDPEGGKLLSEQRKEEIEEQNKLKTGEGEKESSINTAFLIVGFGVLAVLLIMVLIKLNSLNKALADPSLNPEGASRATSFTSLLSKYEKPTMLAMTVIGILAFYGLWYMMFNIGVDKGYKPEQPIYFSHKIHAGEQGIDCQYCHSSAKYSKVSGIPSTNVCMNCHKTIKEYKGEYVEEGKDKKFYTGEIQKIYDAIGWDPASQSYTGEHKPIKWVRIHNMPDFVYFNHQQHVVAGEKMILKAIDEKTIPNYKGLNLPASGNQVCYACHGNVADMNEVQMANKFTMGWCIECHRTTQVDMDNAYNAANYKNLHEKLKKQYGNDVVTVDAIGGLECGKCHY